MASTLSDHAIETHRLTKKFNSFTAVVTSATERDVTRRSLGPTEDKAIYEKPVSELMSQPLITVPPATPVWEALEIMVTKKIRRLPVVDGRHLIGIVTERGRHIAIFALRRFLYDNGVIMLPPARLRTPSLKTARFRTSLFASGLP